MPGPAPPADAADPFDPTRWTAFVLGRPEIDEAAATVRLPYALQADDGERIALVETVVFADVVWPTDPARRAALDGLARLLHLLAGTSYFKLAAPARITLDDDRRGPALAALLRDVYTLGLGEYGYRNGIDPRTRGAWPPVPAPERPPAPAPDRPPVPAPDAPSARSEPGATTACSEPGVGPASAPAATAAPAVGAATPPTLPPTGRTLVPIGGGKDSPVALEVVRAASRELVAFSVGTADAIVGEVAAAGVPHAIARRTLDPRLGALNAAGALNGHVPVTAVVSTIALMAAVLHDCDTVAMANERSASEANLDWDGLAVNHQWSKGADFERALRGVLDAEVVRGLDYRSVLRPAGELAIGRAFAALPAYHPVFTSCNRVFRLDPARRSGHWCGECDKCRFVALALAPWLGPDALRAILRRDPLDEPAQLDGFLDLAGLREHKPFECVGEEAESLAAMRLLADDPVWRGHAVVRSLAEGPLAELERRGGGRDGRGVDLEGPFALDEAALATLPADLAGAVRSRLG